MGAYDISAYCKDCGKDHPVLLRIDLDGGPDRKQSIAELFQSRPKPPQLKAILGHSAFFYKTGRKFKLEKDDEIFLVPPKLFRHHSMLR